MLQLLQRGDRSAQELIVCAVSEADPDGRHFSCRLLRRVFPKEQLHVRLHRLYFHFLYISHINQLHLHDIHLLPVMYISSSFTSSYYYYDTLFFPSIASWLSPVDHHAIA